MADLLGSENEDEIAGFLEELSPVAVMALPYLFEFWALDHQQPPKGDWSTWVLLGGRGAGKTRAGAEWVRSLVEGDGPTDLGKCRRVALIGDTIDQVREVMIFGDSGIIENTPSDRKPTWNSVRKTLVWPNGAEAKVVSAQDPEGLRGPQFDAAWLDELAKWKKARDVWDMLQFALRLGDQPRAMITTTPRDQKLLKEILVRKGTVVTHAPTKANQAHLAPSYLRQIETLYGNTQLGRQEIDGELMEGNEGALWDLAGIDAERVEEAPKLDRIVVAVDPPATSGKSADACGIVVAGVELKGPPSEWRAFVLGDYSLPKASPNEWAKEVARVFEEHQADRVVAEVNMGGEMVEAVLRQQSALIPYSGVRATRGKSARATPVSALYEQGRVSHVGAFKDLEDQMTQMTKRGYLGQGSPDRVDALVWALTDLMVTPAKKFQSPNIRLI